MPPTQATSAPNTLRGRYPQSPSRRGGRGTPRKPQTYGRLADQLEGGLHDLAYINQKYNPNGTLILKKQYLEGGKGAIQDYVKNVYGTILDPSYTEGAVGRVKLFRSVITCSWTSSLSYHFLDVLRLLMNNWV
jgi:hypothetical protein